MPEKWKALFLYGGLSKEEYQQILPDIRRQNHQDLKAYCIVVAVLLGVSAVVVLATPTFTATTAYAYLAGFALSLVLLFLSRYAERIPRLGSCLKYTFICVVYGTGLLITAAQPESLAVAYMVLLVLVPLLFSGSPAGIAVYTAAAVAGLSVYEICAKDAALVTVDIWNAVTYGVLGVLVGIIVQRVRLQNLIQLRKIAVLSESDLLTGLKNRNSFEQNPVVYGNRRIAEMTCVYADVNGLHELNNSQGHKAGDVMLQAVADSILGQFGRDHSYRVGGDEFVVFTFGQEPEETQRRIDRMKAECEAQGYHVSFGFACGKDGAPNMDALVRSAEEKMYLAKAEYYRAAGIDRRQRQ